MRYTHLNFHGGDRIQHRGDTTFSRPEAFQAKFLVQRPEQFRDGEVESSVRRHDGGSGARVWLVLIIT